MAKLSIKAGTTSKLLDVFIQDSSSTTGAGLAGLAFNSGSLTGYYYREGAGSTVAITLATMTVGTWATGGFIALDGTNMPGAYQIGIPDAALASGAKSVLIYFKGATNMAPLPLEIELTAVDNQSATAFVTGINSLSPPSNWNSLSINGSGQVVLSATGSAALTESYSADGAAATLPQLLYLILSLLGEKAISGTTLTAKKLDGSTTAATYTLNDATTPTAITRAT